MIYEATIGVVSAFSTFFITRSYFLKNVNFYAVNAKAKAKMIEKEAKVVLLEANAKANNATNVKMKELHEKECQIQKELESSLDNTKKKESNLDIKIKNLNSSIKHNDNLKKKYENNMSKSMDLLENYTSLTISEAKKIILDECEKNSRDEVAKIVRKYENEAKELAKEKAGYILAIATNRYASDYVFTKLSDKVKLPSNDMKGRIIGKDGRNISLLENLLGVDIIINETPDMISVSSFNTYRRAIAKEVIKQLVDDGRIQPSKIEETYESVRLKFEQNIFNEGEKIVFDFGIKDIHPELIRLIGKLRYRTSYGQNALEHSIEVAKLAGHITAELGGDVPLALRAGILHDIGKSLTEDSEGSHVDLGADICRKHNECDVVINGIYAHHDLEEAKSIECAAVCAGDTLSAARPGARRDAINSYEQRIEKLEFIALNKDGVVSAYAINAGREIRVIVNAKTINDLESSLIAKEISSQISDEVQFPGKVKVNVIREIRHVEYAL